ncbi:ornithine cyclodeaminase [Bradyrhizobium sp. S3.12.5]|uniref:saccharopine dehydrogenase NADP-binding domain-containing protein n=1 Tax=Bradyrhizobium sp. S3.12.5 TaxID=3156386 RepID=UPI0033954454
MAIPLYLSAANVRSCLPDDEIFEVVDRTMRGMATDDVVLGPTEVFAVEQDGARSRVGSMAGCVVSESAAGLKLFFVPGKERPPDVPHVPATIIVCDSKTGLLDGVMDATFLTADRTAAMGVAAALACVRRPLRKAIIVGAGHIGRAAAKFLADTKTVESVTVASRTESSATEVCKFLANLLTRPVALRSTTDVRQAVRDADVVVTATSIPNDADLVCAQWLKEDAIVCSLGSYREVDLELISTAWLVVHDVEHVGLRRSDMREGGAGRDRVVGDVASLMAGRLPLPDDKTRIHVIVGSIGALDVALGARALANARRMKLGVSLV